MYLFNSKYIPFMLSDKCIKETKWDKIVPLLF